MKKIIVITGPTAVGKTKLSIELAKELNGEIINADSTQVFKSLDIATAKVTKKEAENIVHHLIDIKDIKEDYTIFDYQKDCRMKIDEISSRGKIPILVGGTGLYIMSALYDYKFEKENPVNEYLDLSDDEVYKKLITVDPETKIHKNNRKRVNRALSYYEETGKKFSLKETTNKLLYDAAFIGLTTNRETLYKRINNRVKKMVEDGLIEEAKQIYESNIRTKAVMTPIGYKELFEYFDGEKTLNDALDLIKQRSRNYAKRQYTWFNNKMDIKWFETDFLNFNNTINEVLNYIKK